MDTIDVCFAHRPLNLIPILKYALASVVYHSDYLIRELPESHIIFQHALFRTPGLLTQLKDLVFSGLHQEWDEIQPSGVPPDIFILNNISQVPAEVDRLLEQRTLIGNTVTPDYIRSLLDEQYNRFRQLNTSSNNQEHQQNLIRNENQNPENLVVADATGRHQLYNWGGKFRLLPENYTIPNVDLAIIWSQW
jgi:hypothetical protein